MVAVFGKRIAIVVFVGNGKEPVRRDGVFEQGKSPVATLQIVFLFAFVDNGILVNAVPQALQFETDAVSCVNFVSHIKETDIGMDIRYTYMAFDGLHVIQKIDVLGGNVPVLVDFLVDFKIDVAVEHMVANSKEWRFVAIRAFLFSTN